jgi:hypothetical protein
MELKAEKAETAKAEGGRPEWTNFEFPTEIPFRPEVVFPDACISVLVTVQAAESHGRNSVGETPTGAGERPRPAPAAKTRRRRDRRLPPLGGGPGPHGFRRHAAHYGKCPKI